MRGLAGDTVAQETILSCRNVHSGLMANSTVPNWKASSFLCHAHFLSPTTLATFSLDYVLLLFWLEVTFFSEQEVRIHSAMRAADELAAGA